MARVKSALIVDFDNIFAAVGKPFVDGVVQWTKWLEDGAFSPKQARRQFVTKRVYWNLQFDVHRKTFQEAGFETFNCRAFAKNKTAAGKSSADIVMTMDAIQMAGEFRGLDEVIIITTDSDFVPVVNRLQQSGLRVVSAGKETDPTHRLYSEHADDVIHMGALKAACEYEPAKRKWYSLRRPDVKIAALDFAKERRSPLTRKMRDAVDEQKGGVSKTDIQLRRAAAVVVELGERTPDQPLSKAKISRALEQVDGFTPMPLKGQKAWMGLRNYQTMMHRLAKVDSRIDVRKMKGRGTQVIFRVPAAEVKAAAKVKETTPRAQWTDAPVSITG
ncbi:MAG: NYN domain-containing protein [Hyphomonas sp.]